MGFPPFLSKGNCPVEWRGVEWRKPTPHPYSTGRPYGVSTSIFGIVFRPGRLRDPHHFIDGLLDLIHSGIAVLLGYDD